MKDFKPVRHIRTVESGSIIHASVEQKLTSHVPDLVVFDKHYFNIPHVLKFDGVLLFADVSGFTALTEKYTMSSEKGTDALTVTLNDYIGKIVQNILQAGGDVLKFAGDAILAVWKVKERQDIAHAVSQAAKCSLAIQDKCDNQSTDVGVKLRVKIAISAGKIYATFVGNNESCHFVMAGRPVREVNAAEKYCQAGLVVLSPNATELSDKEALILEPISERFALVKYLRREPRKEWRDYIDFPSGLKFTKNAEYSMRVALGIRPDDEREKVVRKYVTPVVQRKLDDHQPLKFLSEMRQCSILFVNLTFDLNERDKRFHEKQSINMQRAFTIVYNNTKDMQGSLNKIFMFDKGCTFLIIFGLPGDKHEQEPAHALQASWKIYQELHKELSTLTLASFGVTTGPVFCGVIGHEERHEYTVIGQKVNLAARFMMHYPNIVSCDFETYNSSKLSKDMFTRLPHQAMKGVGNVIVYGYKEGERQPVGTTTVYQPEYPLIGREEELQLFLDDLRSLKSSQAFGHERRVIVYEGEAGCGKTRLMKEIQWRAACEGVRVASFTFSINDFNSPFFAVKSLLELLLSIEKCQDHKIKEQALLAALDSEETEDLCLLNEIMTVKQMEPDEQTRALHEILVRIVHKVTSHQIVLFALDDAQNIDNDSWALLTTLSKDYRALLVLTMRPFSPEKPPCDSAKQVVYHPKTVFVMLRGLMREHLTPLACQLLHVERIPLELEKLLIERSHNVPHVGGGRKSGSDLFRKSPAVGVVDRSFITRRKTSVGYETNQDQVAKLHKNNDQENTKIDKDARKTIQVSDNDTIKENPTTELSSKGAVLTSWTNRIKWHTDKHQEVGSFLKQVPATDKESLQLRKSATEDNEIPMECIVKPNFDLRKFPVPASIRGMALARLDRMKPFEQLVVKCAAVIGENMSRKMLQTVVPGFQEEKFEAAIYELMLSRVFECASVVSMEEKRELHEKQSTKKIGDHSFCVTCHCAKNIVRQTKEYSSSVNEKDIASGCEQFRFHNSLVQETAYKLWLEDQCRSLHETCAGFLEAKINEVLITGVTDDIITTQFRLSSFAERHMSLLSNSTGFQKSYTVLRNEESVPSIQDGPQNESATSVGVEKNKSTSNELTTSRFNQQRLSYSSVIGRMTQKSVGSRKSVNQPLQFKVADEHKINMSVKNANRVHSE
ncbi:unnamed protein product [Clavelina lepadiformis]|uniref:Guanylate cyclase domain-containing protein n=1 Tax=Clavelina lepadiformis TaxID=159417 RepID=A0ABP0GTE6_CLALP